MEKKPFLTEAMAQEIIQDVPTPFHVYDEKGIRENARRINKAFSWNKGFKEYFAVKALPNPVILQILQEEGCGVDCSSLTELMLSEVCGFTGSDIMFSSNQTPVEDMQKAYELGAYINLDDATMVDFLDRVAGVPETVFCRYNPGGTFSLGESEEGFQVMDKPGDAKYGMTEEQMIDSYKKLMAKGAKHFGIHAFLASNTISDAYYPELAAILFRLAVRVHEATGAHIGYINLSGGVGIPYRPEQTENDILAIGEGVRQKFEEILVPAGMGDVAIFTEMGRFTTGPYGALVATAIHEKHIYKEYIGLDACAANLMRPAMYGAYHHITVLGKENEPCDHMYDVVGGLCENNDKFAIDRMLPKIDIGDVLYIHDTGAHGSAMGYNYNGKLRSAEVLLCEDGVITAVADEGTDLDGYEVIDLHGGYAMPGLINLHVHLAGNGKPSAKPRDNAALVRKILSNGLTRAVAYRMVCSYAKLELLGGVTTIRTVGGIADFDTRCRDDAQAGKILAPRILAANEGISVPGGHMAGSVAVAAHNLAEALAQLTKASVQRVDLVKLMITGGVLDAAEKGTPGELKMPPEMVKAVCDQAHAMGYPVAAHTESPEGVKVALENGVDSIEHGAKMDEETVKLYKEHGAFLCTTISPALPYALFDTAVSGASEKDQYNGRIVFDGIVESAKTALANGIPVGLGNDVGCPYITQYDFWRELCYFHKYCGVSNQFALYTATLRNARLAGVGDVTGSLEVGKSEDLIVTRQNPLEDLRALQHLELVACRGRVVKKPAPKRSQTVDKLLDPYLE